MASRGCASAARLLARARRLAHIRPETLTPVLPSEGGGALPRPQMGTAARSPTENDAHSAKNLRGRGAAIRHMGTEFGGVGHRGGLWPQDPPRPAPFRP